MATYPYAYSKKSLKGVLDKILDVKVPKEVNKKWLSSQGFDKKPDSAVINVLKLLGFIDEDGEPTAAWRAYKVPNKSMATMAQAIRRGYADLFAMYPDAELISNNDLKNFFLGHGDIGKSALNMTISTFTTLCEYADFNGATESSPLNSEPQASNGSKSLPSKGNGKLTPELPEAPALHIDIQIHISPSADANQIDNIFRSMAKHLYSVDAT